MSGRTGSNGAAVDVILATVTFETGVVGLGVVVVVVVVVLVVVVVVVDVDVEDGTGAGIGASVALFPVAAAGFKVVEVSLSLTILSSVELFFLSAGILLFVAVALSSFKISATVVEFKGAEDAGTCFVMSFSVETRFSRTSRNSTQPIAYSFTFIVGFFIQIDKRRWVG